MGHDDLINAIFNDGIINQSFEKKCVHLDLLLYLIIILRKL